MHDVAEGAGLRDNPAGDRVPENGESLQGAADLQVRLDEEVEGGGGTEGSAEAAGLGERAEGVGGKDIGERCEGLEEGRGWPAEANADESVGEEGKGERGMGEAKV